MIPLALFANPKVTDAVLRSAGYLAGLGQSDVRELEAKPIKVWLIAGASALAGVALGIYVARKLPRSWILGK